MKNSFDYLIWLVHWTDLDRTKADDFVSHFYRYKNCLRQFLAVGFMEMETTYSSNSEHPG